MEKICRECKKAFKFDEYEYSEPSFCRDDIEYHIVHCPHCNTKNWTQEVRTEEYITKKYYSIENKHENADDKKADVAFLALFIFAAIMIVFVLPFIL